jgi:hypothetical protein
VSPARFGVLWMSAGLLWSFGNLVVLSMRSPDYLDLYLRKVDLRSPLYWLGIVMGAAVWPFFVLFTFFPEQFLPWFGTWLSRWVRRRFIDGDK